MKLQSINEWKEESDYQIDEAKKDIWNESQVVYSVPCEEPPDKYIGQTKQKLKVRIREHERSCDGDLSGIQSCDKYLVRISREICFIKCLSYR